MHKCLKHRSLQFLNVKKWSKKFWNIKNLLNNFCKSECIILHNQSTHLYLNVIANTYTHTFAISFYMKVPDLAMNEKRYLSKLLFSLQRQWIIWPWQSKTPILLLENYFEVFWLCSLILWNSQQETHCFNQWRFPNAI